MNKEQIRQIINSVDPVNLINEEYFNNEDEYDKESEMILSVISKGVTNQEELTDAIYKIFNISFGDNTINKNITPYKKIAIRIWQELPRKSR